MIDYRVVYGCGNVMHGAAHELREVVLKYLAEGWEPQGGVCQDADGDLCQAMVKRSPAVSDSAAQ